MGADIYRITTPVTEADISGEHFEYVKDRGLEANGLLMLSHMASSEIVLEQAHLMEKNGENAVYVMDSAGVVLPDDIHDRVKLLAEEPSIDADFMHTITSAWYRQHARGYRSWSNHGRQLAPWSWCGIG